MKGSLFAFVFGLLMAPSLWAHHPPRTSNVQTPGPVGGRQDDAGPLQMGVDLELHHFEYRVRNQTQKGEHELNIFRVTPSLRLSFKSGSDLRLEVPAGHIFEAGLTGLADPTLAAGQALRLGDLRLYGNVALSIPLSTSQKKTLFSASDLITSGSSLELVTYNIQAALSAQTPMLSALVEARHALPMVDFVSIGGRLEGATPLSQTQQGIVFGEDLSAALFSHVEFKTFSVGLGVFGEHHFADHSFDKNDTFGQRSALGTLASVSVALSKNFSCRAQIQAPFWQQALGAQMLRRASLRGGCVTAFDP